MRISVDAHELMLALKRLMPRRKYRSMRETNVIVTAGGGSVILRGTLDSSSSLAADVHEAGELVMPLESAVKLLSTYGKGTTVEVRGGEGFIEIGKMKLGATPAVLR